MARVHTCTYVYIRVRTCTCRCRVLRIVIGGSAQVEARFYCWRSDVPLRAIGQYFLVTDLRFDSPCAAVNSKWTIQMDEAEQAVAGSRVSGPKAATSRFPKRDVTAGNIFAQPTSGDSGCAAMKCLYALHCTGSGTAHCASGNLWKHNVTTCSNICAFRIELRCFCLSRCRDIALSRRTRVLIKMCISK